MTYFEREFTPDNIQTLKPNEIFVFGSNLQGRHMRGAARMAAERFGAIMGVGVGLQGQSYAIPTMQGGVDTIKPYIYQFIRMAALLPHLKFYVTRIGCGIAGFSDKEIAPYFNVAYDLPNVVLPQSFFDIINTARRYASETQVEPYPSVRINFYPEDLERMHPMSANDKLELTQALIRDKHYIIAQ